jgi:hypothetical protein
MLKIASYHNNSLIEHVLSNEALCGFVDIAQEIVNKGANINAKGKNINMFLYLTCEKTMMKWF